MGKAGLILFLFFSFTLFSQDYNFDGQWQFIGPDDKPTSWRPRTDAGLGPIEFIRVYQKEEGYLLAGSLNGGLFFSTDGAETWINSGSDHWPYSTCGWADFYPEDKNIWFATSHNNENNGKPGPIGEEGGLYRTLNQGSNWQRIGDLKDFGSKYTTLYGTRFHPKNPKMLFVMTSDGLIYTNDCLAENVTWKRAEGLKGWIYDMDFLNGKIYISNFFQSKWDVLVFEGTNWTSVKKIGEIEALQATMRSITTEPKGEDLLILVDNVSGSDELWQYYNTSGKTEMLARNQTVNFGSGHTFAVSPYNDNEVLIGSSVLIKKWFLNDERMSSKQMATGYHVDVEFVSYDPFDSSKIYLATHGGVFLSEDKGESWICKSKGLGVAEVMGLSVSAQDLGMIAIGCFHDGTSILADFDKNGNYYWRIVNGGDALIPIIHPDDPGIVYTSNQYSGGGIFFSSDTARNNKNIHNANNFNTAGWEIGATLHPIEKNLLFFNFMYPSGDNKGNIDAARTEDASQNKNAEIISDFKKTHKLKKYKVYSLFNSSAYPDELYAYVLHFAEENGKTVTHHRLFKTEIARDSASKVIDSWYELTLPRDYWLADLEQDPQSNKVIYVSYTGPKENQDAMYGDKGMVYALKYSKTNALKREIDISSNMKEDVVGRYNMLIPEGTKELFIVTRSGVYYGTKKQMKGKRQWQEVGFGLPHCKPFGIFFDANKKALTVGLLGRGVWRYYL